MAQTLKIAKNNPQVGRVKGKALFESVHRTSLLDKEITILEPGEKATVAPGHKLWVCVDSLSRQYFYHARSKATLTGPLVYATAPCDEMGVCDRVQDTLDETVMFGVVFGFFGLVLFAATFAAPGPVESLFALALSGLLLFGCAASFRHAIRYKRLDDNIYNTHDVIAEIEQVGFSAPTKSDKPVDEPVDEDVPAPSGHVSMQLRKD